jgi:hypothetical protein
MDEAFKNLFVLFFTLLLMGLVGEAAVRVFTDISPPLTVRDVKVGNTYRKNRSKTLFAPESGKDVLMTTNNEGFRGPTRPVAKKDNTIRIAMIGDSQIAAINTNEEETFVVLLENKLNHLHPNKKWEVFNFGVSGASTAQELNLYREIIKKYDMDIVVCAYLNTNDFSDNSIRLSNNPRIYMDFAVGTDDLVTVYLNPTKKASNWLNENSRLYVWQKHMMTHATQNLVSRGAAGKDSQIRGGSLIFVDDPKDEDIAYTWRLNRKIIHAFHDAVTEDGATFIFLSIPHHVELLDGQWKAFEESVSGTKYEGKMNRDYPQHQLMSIVTDRKIMHLFLAVPFAEHMSRLSPADPRYYTAYQSGTGHLNETGNLLMTDLFYEYMDKEEMIQKLTERR